MPQEQSSHIGALPMFDEPRPTSANVLASYEDNCPKTKDSNLAKSGFPKGSAIHSLVAASANPIGVAITAPLVVAKKHCIS